MIFRIGAGETHLIGSMHVLPDGAKPSAEQLELQKNADRVLFESDLDNVDGIDWPKLGALDARKSLSEILPSDLYRDASRAWSERKISGRLGKTQPWMVAMKMVMQLAATVGLSHSNGSDRQLWDATEPSKRGWLESAQSGMGPLISATRREIEFQIRLAAVTPAVVTERLLAMYEGWRTHDADAFLQAHRILFEETPVLAQATLDERNAAWLPIITKAVGGTRATLVVVGSLHLVGSNSLPDLLSHAGIAVERVK